MFIAMNRFKVRKGEEATFEALWRNREFLLGRVPGFIEFHLLRGPEGEDHTLFSTHTLWNERADFENWTKSEEFRIAHANTGRGMNMVIAHPVFEGFEVVIALGGQTSVAA